MPPRNAKSLRRQVGLRLAPQPYLIARMLTIRDRCTMAQALEPLLEAALEAEVGRVEEILAAAETHLTSGTAVDLSPVSERADETVEPAELRPVTVRLAPHAYDMAAVLAAASGSIPRACEPLLERALLAKAHDAAATVHTLRKRLREGAAIGANPVGEPATAAALSVEDSLLARADNDLMVPT